MDIFDKKVIKPMLIKNKTDPFNSPDYIYELKLDGIRCIAFLDKNETDLRNKRNIPIIRKFPELSQIHKQITERCILDGELIVMKDDAPDFYEVQRRTVLTDSFKIQMAYKNYPASFVAYDILYYGDKEITDRPLMIRKSVLENCINENSRIAISRFIEESGIELFHAAEIQKLEGVVGKRKESLYWQDKKSADWIKFKRLQDEDFIICGIVYKKPMSTLLLGQYQERKLIYKGSVSFGVRASIVRENNLKVIPYSPFKADNSIDEKSVVTWIKPDTVCTIEYMPNTKDSLRQPVLKGIRDDVLPFECQVK